MISDSNPRTQAGHTIVICGGEPLYRLIFLMLAAAIWLGAAPVTFTYSGYLTEGPFASSSPQFMVLSFTFERTSPPDFANENHALYPVLSFEGTLGAIPYGGSECHEPGVSCSSSISISNDEEFSGKFTDDFLVSFLIDGGVVRRGYVLLLRTVLPTAPLSLTTTALPPAPPDPSAFAEASLTFSLEGFRFPIQTAAGRASVGANPIPEPSAFRIAGFSLFILAVTVYRGPRGRA